MGIATVVWKGSLLLVTQPGSGKITLTDRVTTTDIYRGPINLCYSSLLRRGTFGTGGRLGWVVTSSTVDPERKGIGLLTINWELGGSSANPAYLPLDEFELQPVELNPKVERHPLMYGTTYPGNPHDCIGIETIALCYTAINGATIGVRKQAVQTILNLASRESAPPTGTTWADQGAWAVVLLDWLSHGQETYYEAGLRYSWIWYSFTVPTTTMGGFTQAPLGPLYGCFPANASALRLADSVQSAGVNGSAFKVTSNWLIGRNGFWNPIMYPAA
jgi:hypothetical protein